MLINDGTRGAEIRELKPDAAAPIGAFERITCGVYFKLQKPKRTEISDINFKMLVV